MYDVKLDKYGNPFLSWSDRKRESGERGLWIEIGHSEATGIREIVKINRQFGLDILMDEEGFYRALVLKD